MGVTENLYDAQLFSLLTSRPENQSDRVCVGKAEHALDYYTGQELFDQDTRNQTS